MPARKKSRNEYLHLQLRKNSPDDINAEIRNRRRSLDEFLGFYNQLVNKDASLRGRRTSEDVGGVEGDESELNLGNAVRSCLKMLAFRRTGNGWRDRGCPIPDYRKKSGIIAIPIVSFSAQQGDPK